MLTTGGGFWGAQTPNLRLMTWGKWQIMMGLTLSIGQGAPPGLGDTDFAWWGGQSTDFGQIVALPLTS